MQSSKLLKAPQTTESELLKAPQSKLTILSYITLMTCHTTKHHAMYTNNILTFNTENSLCLSTQSLKDAATLNF